MSKGSSQNSTKTGSGGISRQISLPFSKSIEITIKSLKVRLLRNMITVAALVLAVAFLSYVFINTDLANGILKIGGEKALELLSGAGYDVSESTKEIGASAKSRWIVILSLLVCTVGIVNAQLMSVTERFREIGVMKCLGALDSMVLRLFLLEALFQGFIGSLAGGLVGLLAAMLQGLIRFGPACFTSGVWPHIFVSFVYAVGIGCLLSVLGVLYPAILAARMKPVKALSAEH